MGEHSEKALREALNRIHRVATGQSDRAYMSIPADPHRDADLILTSAIDELVTLRTQLAAVQAERDDLRVSFDRTIDREDANRKRAEQAEARVKELGDLVEAGLRDREGLRYDKWEAEARAEAAESKLARWKESFSEELEQTRANLEAAERERDRLKDVVAYASDCGCQMGCEGADSGRKILSEAGALSSDYRAEMEQDIRRDLADAEADLTTSRADVARLREALEKVAMHLSGRERTDAGAAWLIEFIRAALSDAPLTVKVDE